MTSARPVAPSAVRWIARTLEEAGHETWAVGGAVRDALMGRASGDWDLTTHAKPGEVRRLFKRTVPIGIEHGTVGVLARDGTMYEVTTFRRDVETDGRHAVVSFAEHLEDDLSRRDFTINAIAWHPLREALSDPFGGIDDIDDGILRTVGDPMVRFREDHLRILRAFRFAGRFRMTIDPDTWHALMSMVSALPNLSAERIRDELLKVLDADPQPSIALSLYREGGGLGVLYPELEDAIARSETGDPASDAWRIALATVDALPTGRPLSRLAGLLRGLSGEAVVGLLTRLRLSNAQTEETALRALAAPVPRPEASDADFRRWLSRNGAHRISALARIDLAAMKGRASLGAVPACDAVVSGWRRARDVRRAGPPLTVSDLQLDGRALINLGMRPGPHFGEILDALLDWVLEDPARNDRALLEERALTLADERSGSDG